MGANCLPWAAAIADMLATSTDAEEDTPLPSGTAEETCSKYEKNLQLVFAEVAVFDQIEFKHYLVNIKGAVNKQRRMNQHNRRPVPICFSIS